MGWSPSETLAADPAWIEMAWEARCEDMEIFQRTVYGAQGVKLPEKPRKKKLSPKTVADQFRLFKAGHNARLEALRATRPPKRR